MGLPSGYVTFLFTDVEGSTRLFQQHPEAMTSALARHDTLVRAAIARYGGHVFQHVGDGMCAAFDDAGGALAAALEAQRALFDEPWPTIGAMKVRMGLHSGSAEARDGAYVSSLTLARAQRVASSGHGGQTLLSKAAAEAVRGALPGGVALREMGWHKLRGITESELLSQVVVAGLPSEFPPLATEPHDAGATPLAQLAREKLVGRHAEAGILRESWQRAQQARGHLLLLSGEPGIGKTRLAQDLLQHAQGAGAAVLRGGCYEYEATTPYLPFVEALREWTRRHSAAQLRDTLGDTATEMAKLAPEIAAKLGPLQVNPELPPAEERLRLFDHTARFIARVAADRGALLFIDDLHWADQGTLSLLHYLMRQLRNDRVLVLAAYREVELDRRHPLAKALVEWNRERLATRLALARLSHADTAALLGALFGTKTVSGEFVDVVYRETEGNPFFIEEAVKSLVEQGHVYRDGEAWARKEIHELALPQSVKEAIGRRLDRLADETVDALRTAAALGKRFSFRELAAASPGDEDTLLDALDHAVAAQLVRADGSSSKGDDVFAFTHDKIREVLNEEANPIRRRRLHQRIGEALERLYGVDAGAAAGDDEHAHDLAHHFMQAGDLVRSLGYARRAARNATRVFAHDEALAFLGQAREAAEALKQADTLVDLDEAMGDVHNERGTMLHAVECYRRSIAGTDDRARRAAQKSKIGVSYCTIGDQRGLPYLDEALAELDPQTQTSELALATALMGRYYHYRTEHRRAIALLERAHALAAPRADLLTMTLIQSYLAGAHQHLLEFEASDRWARATCELGERTGFSQAKASGWEFLGENANNRGIWIDGLAYATKDYEEGVRTGNLSRVGWGQFGVAQALYGKGELLRARKTAEDAFALAERIGEVRLASWLGPVLACACADLGDDEAAAEAAERNLPRARELGQMLLTAWALHAQGYAAMMRGDADKSVEWYAQYLPLVADTENGVARLIILPACAEAHARSGRLDEGEAIARRAIEVADVARAPHQKAVALRVIARVRAARGDVEGAREICGRALTLLDQVGGQLQWARTLALRGGWTGDRADVARAREVFEASAARDLSELR